VGDRLPVSAAATTVSTAAAIAAAAAASVTTATAAAAAAVTTASTTAALTSRPCFIDHKSAAAELFVVKCIDSGLSLVFFNVDKAESTAFDYAAALSAVGGK
jgi:hypothetical protein